MKNEETRWPPFPIPDNGLPPAFYDRVEKETHNWIQNLTLKIALYSFITGAVAMFLVYYFELRGTHFLVIVVVTAFAITIATLLTWLVEKLAER